MSNYEESAVEAEELGLAATRTRRRNDGEELRTRSANSLQGKGRYSKDIEKGQIVSDVTGHQQAAAQDPNLVTWDGKDDPSNPKNWPRRRKWYATFIMASFTFISPLSSSIVAPAISQISLDLNVTSTVEQSLVFSIFVLAYAIGPLFLGPLSEIYGRVPVLQLANLFYLVFNTAAGFSKTKAQMVVFRFLSGLGGSAPLAVGGGVIADLWRAEERGAAISIYSLAPLLGPGKSISIGPIASGFIAEKTRWGWVFWAPSLADVVIQISGLFFLQETYAPCLLYKKAIALRKETGNENLVTEYEHPEQSAFNKLKHGVIRPFIMIGTQPIIQVLALYMAYLYGTIYLFLASFPTLWTSVYHESLGISGLNYISLGLGPFLGAQLAAFLQNPIYAHFKVRNNDIGLPEFRLPIMVPASLLVPTGLFWFAWSAQAHVHWIMPNIGAVLYTIGGIVGFQGITIYLVDAYTQYAASAIAAAAVLRSLAGFGFPLFAPYLYDDLGYGWGGSVLAFIAIGLGVPAPLLIWRFGAALRARSPYAAGGDE